MKNIDFLITRKQLFDLLGEPQSFEANKTKWNSMLYLFDNNFEFYFHDGHYDEKSKDATLRLIQINLLGQYANESIKFKEYGWTSDLAVDEAIKFLEKHKIKFEEEPYPFSDDARILATEGGVKIAFSNWYENFGEPPVAFSRLRKIWRSINTMSPTRVPTKQIGLQIELKYYEMLRKNAEKTKVSISKQCREIIENHFKKQNEK